MSSLCMNPPVALWHLSRNGPIDSQLTRRTLKTTAGNWPEPLSSFPYKHTKDPDEWLQFVNECTLFTKYNIVSDNNFYAFYNSIDFGRLSLNSAGNIFELSYKYNHNTDFFYITFLISGTAEIQFNNKLYSSVENKLVVFNPGNGFSKLRASLPISIFILFKKSAIEDAVYTRIGKIIHQRLLFTNTNKQDSQNDSYLENLIITTENIFNNCPQIAREPLITSQYEELLFTALLVSLPHNYSYLFDGSPPPATSKVVKLAEEYIEANIDQPLRLGDLAAVTGVGTRSIQAAFKRHRGYSPSQFLRECRLTHAHQILQQAPPNLSLMAVSLSCGFASQSRFCQHYHKRFGEKPSETLAKNKQ